MSMMVQVGFPQRDPNRLQLALDHSHSVLWIRSMKQSRWARQGQLLGFARATSDGALSATIWDVAVSCKHCLACSHESTQKLCMPGHAQVLTMAQMKALCALQALAVQSLSLMPFCHYTVFCQLSHWSFTNMATFSDVCNCRSIQPGSAADLGEG